jgi:DNA modification methylase
VVDPFAGVGTIGIAARELGFEYLGAEIIAEYAGRARAALGVEAPTLGLAV